MKILWHSNTPWAGTGYGNQTAIFPQRLHDAGHDIVISAYYGLQGAPLTAGGIKILPVGYDPWGNDVLPLHKERYQPDVMFAFMDIWVLDPDMLKETRLAVWTPIDHQPMPPRVKEHLQSCIYPVAMSRFGEAEMKKAGFDPFFIPCGVDCKEFAPRHRDLARAKWKVDPNTFLVVMNAANKGVPSRKSFEQVVKAWGEFVKRQPNALLYIHASPGPWTHGLDLITLMDFYGIPKGKLLFADSYKYRMGEYTWAALADLYSAADVLLSPSKAEGFGIPIIEAQACGCPVIVTDYSSMPELCFGGYKIPIDTLDDLSYTVQESEQVDVPPSAILKGLLWALENRGNQALRDQAREGALEYDADRILQKYMLPVFQQIAERNRDEQVGADGKVIEPKAVLLWPEPEARSA